MSTTPPRRKRYQDMTLNELRAATKQFNAEHVEGKPLSPAMRARHGRAMKRRPIKSKGGRPKIGLGAAVVPVSLERGLLKEADTFAKRQKMSRSELVALGLRLAMEKGKKSA